MYSIGAFLESNIGHAVAVRLGTATFLLCLSTSLCLADTIAPVIADFNQVFGPLGFTMTGEPAGSGVCHPVLELDQAKVLTRLSTLRTLGILSPDVSDQRLLHAPNTTSFAIMLLASSIAAKTVYDHDPLADRCHFEQFVTRTDDYGNPARIQVLSFDFTRALYHRIGWSSFLATNLLKIAPGFRLDPGFESGLADEAPDLRQP